MRKHVAPLGYTILIPLFALGEAANTNFNLTQPGLISAIHRTKDERSEKDATYPL
jgi:hypothetical protein